MKNDAFGDIFKQMMNEFGGQPISTQQEMSEQEFVDSVIRGMNCETSVPHDTVMKNVRDSLGIQVGKHYCIGASKVTRDRAYINDIILIVDVIGPKAFVEVLNKYNNKPVRKILEISEYDWTYVERMKDFYVDTSA